MIDIEVEVRDDLGVASIATATVTKGAPCVSADTCAAGQYCDAGRCIWDPSIGEIGDACTYPQFCLEERCDTHEGASFCTRSCLADIADSCPTGTECLGSGGDAYCWPASDSGGCCSSSRGIPWSGCALGLLVLALAARRRR